MKKNEIALLIIIIAIVLIATYSLLNTFMSGASTNSVAVEKAESIDSSISKPSDAIFNDQAINPTVKVTIGDQANRQPFTVNQ